MKKRYVLFVMLLVAVLGSSCQPSSVATPASVAAENSARNVSPFVVPTPKADKGVITGQLLTPGAGGRPYIATLYLGTLIYANETPDAPPLISFAKETAPLGVQDPETGRFYFADIAPGTYALILWTPVTSMPLRNAETGEDIVIEVKANEVTDLGIIPIP